MKYSEAKRVLKGVQTVAQSVTNNRRIYNAVKLARLAIDKQIPDDVVWEGEEEDGAFFTSCYCPVCAKELRDEQERYCEVCGQALCWGEE